MTMVGVDHGGIRKKRKRVSLEGVSNLTSQLRSNLHKATVNKTHFTINTRRPGQVRPHPVQHGLLYDWTIQTEGAHYARNRSSFSSYTPLNFQLSNGQWVQGMGSVHILIQGPDRVHSLDLEHVLHVPRAICNGVSTALLPSSQITFSPVDGCRDQNGDVVWLSEYFHGFYRLVLPGNAARDTSLDDALRTGARLVDDSLSVCLSDSDVNRIQERLISL